MIELKTKRLKLRQWQESDFPLFANINADLEVMAHFPSTMSQTQSNEMAKRIQALISERGWGFWAIEKKKTHEFIGFVGLHEPIMELPFSPCVEIGWRLAKEHWGKGYASEAAKEALKFAFGPLSLAKVYSFTSTSNLKSRAVMERLKMVNTRQNFEHPQIPPGNLLREHVLYEITRERWNRMTRPT